MADFLKCFFLVLLPPRYRQAFGRQSAQTMVRAAFLSGIVQGAVFGELFLGGYIEYRKHPGVDVLAFFEYLVLPSTWLFSLFWFDGTIRVLGSVAGEAVGSLPLYPVSWIHGLMERRGRRAYLGAKVADLVEPCEGQDYSLRIASCRRKPNWDRLMTVRYQEELYEIVREEFADPPRRFVYLLRPRPGNKVIRGLHNYSPDEVLSSED